MSNVMNAEAHGRHPVDILQSAVQSSRLPFIFVVSAHTRFRLLGEIQSVLHPLVSRRPTENVSVWSLTQSYRWRTHYGKVQIATYRMRVG